jgi:hypothetical protein
MRVECPLWLAAVNTIRSMQKSVRERLLRYKLLCSEPDNAYGDITTTRSLCGSLGWSRMSTSICISTKVGHCKKFSLSISKNTFETIEVGQDSEHTVHFLA